MHERAVQLGLLALLVTANAGLAFENAATATSRPATRSAQPARESKQRHASKRPKPPSLPCGNLLAFQVLMDREGFSSGQIDGQSGPNFQHALAAFQTARNVPATGQPDCATWQALNGDSAADIVAKYEITNDDVNARYQTQIPKELVEQAKLPDLGYTSMLERLAERFHTSPALLKRLNAGASFVAGATISVPGVQPFDAAAKPAADAAAGDVTVVVARDDSSLRAIRGDGSLVFFAPVTTGSEHDPLPPGDWTVKGVQWRPPFHYNPDLFWDAKPEDTKATIKPGPNNPVGVVWIDLSLEHYGLHGTPAPEQVGHTASHGCVRLTNWDAARVASLVKPGTVVQFR
jgi:lipoprotein-anchoring transpeptidase ErfK/SrfK